MKEVITILSMVEKNIAKVFMGLMTALVIFDVISREIFNTGLPWAQKSAVYLMIWSGFLGAIMISEKAAHLRPEVADKIWGEKGKILFVRIQNLVSILFCSFFMFASYRYVSQSFEFGDKSVVLDIPLWILQLIIPYMFFSILLRHLYFLLNPNEQLAIKKEIH